MAISSSKCTEFAVKEQFSRSGKSRGHAVVGRAAIHDRFEVVEHDGVRLQYPALAVANGMLEGMRAEFGSGFD